MEKANDRQIGGDHYKKQPYQHWDFVAHTHQNYFQGQATRYISRARLHVDGPKENYEKALHYVDKAEELRLHYGYAYNHHDLKQFAEDNELWAKETEAITAIMSFNWPAARDALTRLIAELV